MTVVVVPSTASVVFHQWAGPIYLVTPTVQ
jgi:hypothetical protein